jgi:dihydropteroate synthase
MSSNPNIQKFREELRTFAKANRVGLLGILNTTPDSFFDGGKNLPHKSAVSHGLKMIDAGADIVDIGGASSRPGAPAVTPTEEWKRVEPVIKGILDARPDVFISIDTYNASVARKAVENGAVMVNDISAGSLDPDFIPTVADLNVPYVLMHMKGAPENMQDNPNYENVVNEVSAFFKLKISQLESMGITDVILDPGFGFGKRLEDNYSLLKNLREFTNPGKPLLIGVSRKSMINKALGCNPEDSLNGTSALNAIALQNGASFLRVHDIAEAHEVRTLHNHLCKS